MNVDEERVLKLQERMTKPQPTYNSDQINHKCKIIYNESPSSKKMQPNGQIIGSDAKNRHNIESKEKPKGNPSMDREDFSEMNQEQGNPNVYGQIEIKPTSDYFNSHESGKEVGSIGHPINSANNNENFNAKSELIDMRKNPKKIENIGGT